MFGKRPINKNQARSIARREAIREIAEEIAERAAMSEDALIAYHAKQNTYINPSGISRA